MNPRWIERDRSLPHQVVITKSHDTNHIVVSCNCLVVEHHNRIVYYEPIGVISNFQDTVRLYNNPENHRGILFLPIDEIGHKLPKENK